ncbi:MAG: S53 family serine peptidase [Terriglobales bacterium]
MFRRLCLISVLAIVSLTNTLCHAQRQSLLTRHVREATLNGQAVLVGSLPLTQVLHLDIVLPLRDRAGLQSFLRQQYDPASPFYQQFLTPQEINERFGPSQEEWDALVAFAKASGFEIVGGTRDSRDLWLTGTVANIQNAFSVTLGVYQDPAEDRTFYSPDREPTVDLPFQLWHITGLDNNSRPHPLYVKKSDYVKTVGINPKKVHSNTTGSGPGGSFLGSDMRKAYYQGTSLTGSGQNIALFELAGSDLADLTTYYNNVGQTEPYTPTLISTGGYATSCLDSGSSPCDDTEQTIDMTQAMGMAPGSTMLYNYVCGNVKANGTGNFSDTACISAMVTTTAAPLSKQISCSWGWTPADKSTLDPYFEQMASQGQNFFAASGDSSTWSASNEAWPADDANIVSVGGTDLTTSGAGGPWSSETAWADSGGGISPDSIPIPSWQQISGVINSSNGGSTTLRNGPDVAAEANFDFYYCADQKACSTGLGGTSFAAPMWAGYLALANQQAAANSESIGFINPIIYPPAAAGGTTYSNLFHDITSGTSGSHSAVTGYDLVTGWGSPKTTGPINLLAPTGGGGSFTLSDSPSSLTITQGGNGTSTMTVTDAGGFTGSVTLAASGLPSGVTAQFSPNPTTTSSTLTLTASATAATGTVTVTITGTSGSLQATTTLALTVNASVSQNFTISASPSSLTVVQGSNGASTITITSQNSFSSATTLTASGLPSGVTAAFAPNPVTPPANSSVNSTLTLTASGTATTGTSTITITGTSGTLVHSTPITLTVSSAGGGGLQVATYSSTFKAPTCASLGSGCDSGPSLLLGRDTLSGGSEPNQPNTINSSCADGTSGTYHSDESNDRLVVQTTDGSNMAPGKTVKVSATVWAYSGFTSDHLDLYYAANASSPSWVLIGTIAPTAAGAQVLSANYTLPSGGTNQAVRAQFRYQGSASSCTTGAYNDHDDLVFPVGAGTPGFTVAAAPSAVTVVQGSNASSTITVTSLNSFNSATTLTASGLPTGVTAAFNPNPVTPPANGNVTSTLTFTASATATTGTSTVTVTGTSGSIVQTTNITLTVTPAGGGQTAVYDSTLKAPKCATVGSSCDSGPSLLLGRDTLSGGNEPNQPNTINNSCSDGTAGTFHSDESNDRLVVASTSGGAMTHATTVTVTATVWAYSSYTSDHLDLYYAANANSPSWVLIGTFTPSGSGARNISATYTLPTGSLQAVRANFRYTGSASSCSTGSYDDHDDLIFAVN